MARATLLVGFLLVGCGGFAPAPDAGVLVNGQDGGPELTDLVALCEAVPVVCTDGWIYEQRFHDGACESSPLASCFPYACGSPPTACRTRCEAQSECSGGAVCIADGTCSVVEPDCPTSCTNDTEMISTWNDGACRDDYVVPCFPYACDEAAGRCRRSCVTSEDCAAGSTCANEGTCAPVGSSCVDHETVQYSDTTTVPCAPYACVAGACTHWCVSDGDCAAGAACQITTQVCVLR